MELAYKQRPSVAIRGSLPKKHKVINYIKLKQLLAHLFSTAVIKASQIKVNYTAKDDLSTKKIAISKFLLKLLSECKQS